MSNANTSIGVLERLRPMPNVSEKQEKRFWNKVILKANLDKCWEWIRTKDKSGYGMVNLNYKTYRSHRVSYFIYYKQDPVGKFVCHTCDNPMCCNPNHLFLGTPLDNFDDMEAKGRNYLAIANGNGMSKLDSLDILEIKKLFFQKQATRKQLAKMYNHDYSVICKIIKGKLWTSVN